MGASAAPSPEAVACCWSAWGAKDACGSYPSGGKGGLCSTDFSKKCSSATDCPTTPVPPPAPPAPPTQDVETPRHRFSRSPLAQTWKDAAGGDVESSRQLASATLASSITSSVLAVPQKTVPCSTLLLTFARIQNPSVIQSRPQRSSGLLDSSTG